MQIHLEKRAWLPLRDALGVTVLPVWGGRHGTLECSRGEGSCSRQSPEWGWCWWMSPSWLVSPWPQGRAPVVAACPERSPVLPSHH